VADTANESRTAITNVWDRAETLGRVHLLNWNGSWNNGEHLVAVARLFRSGKSLAYPPAGVGSAVGKRADDNTLPASVGNVWMP
jgi:hypothetical protein